jgi:dinuclear metal center YbgI/SA1388 family protein
VITLQELIDHLDALLEPSQFDDFCPNGLQVEGGQKISSIGLAVSASLATIEAAVEAGVDALIVHHGIFWNNLSPCVTKVNYKKISLLLKNGISLLAYHLPLDAHQEVGNNWRAARDLGWDDLRPFDSRSKRPIGVQGRFTTRSIDSFVKELEAYYGHAAHVALGGPSRVSSAALISGGANRQLVDAIKAGVDCFITGSFDEPQWHMAFEENIHFIALGHSATERVGPRALGDHLSESFGLNARFLDIPNPF